MTLLPALPRLSHYYASRSGQAIPCASWRNTPLGGMIGGV